MHGSSILVIDDDPDVLELVTDVLQDAGYETTTAADGEEAAQLLAWQTFDMVVSDIMLPRLNGMRLLERVRREHPRMPVVLISGYATHELADEAMRRGGAHILLKPFSPADLLDTVRAAVDGQGAESLTG